MTTPLQSTSPIAPSPAGNPEDGCLSNLIPGMVYNDRYILYERINAGSKSVVWSAAEKIQDENSTRTLARRTMKFLKCTDHEQEQELWVLNIIANATKRSPDHPGAKHVLQLLDKFAITHEHGRHIALITPLFTHSLDFVQAQYAGQRMPVDVVRNVARQLLEALAFLHDECKVVHGNVSWDNILFSGHGATRMTDNQVLIDYSTSMSENTDPAWETLAGPTTSPELVAGLKLDRKTDIWSAGCLIFDLLAGRQLFPSIEDSSLMSSAQWAYAHMVVFCRLPDEEEDEINAYFSRGTRAAHLFPTGTTPMVEVHEDHRMSIGQILERYEIHSPELLDLLQGMLRLRPGDRPSAQELLTHSWLAVVDSARSEA